MPYPTTGDTAAHRFPVTVRCTGLPQAQRVMAARLGHDQDCDFTYTLDWHGDAVSEDADRGESTAPFTFAVNISGCALADARQVLVDRLGHDEEYGFDYALDWTLSRRSRP